MLNIHHSIKLIPLIATLLLTPCISFALDIIYLKNESVIKGTIVEHNIAAKKYTIKTSDGSLFVFKAEEIIKITKEASVITPHTTPTIVINNTNTNNNQDTLTNNNTLAEYKIQKEPKKWKILLKNVSFSGKKEVYCDSCQWVEGYYKNKQKWQDNGNGSGSFITDSTWVDGYQTSGYHTENIHNDGSGIGISYALGEHVSLAYSSLSTSDNDVTTIDLLFATNTFYTGWNWYIGISRVRASDDSYSATTLGGEYNLKKLTLGLSNTSLNDVEDPHSDVSIGSVYLAMRL